MTDFILLGEMCEMIKDIHTKWFKRVGGKKSLKFSFMITNFQFSEL